MSMPAALAEVVSDFQEVDGQDKLALLLEFADELPALPADLEEAAMEPVPECQSPLFLHVDADDPISRRTASIAHTLASRALGGGHAGFAHSSSASAIGEPSLSRS